MKPNLSLFERFVRPLLGGIVASVALTQPNFGWIEGMLVFCGILLILNGVLARCYLWKWLGINTARNEFDLCTRAGRSNDNEPC